MMSSGFTVTTSHESRNVANHPTYGHVAMNTWLPVFAHRTIKVTQEHELVKMPLYEIMFIPNKDPGYLIRNMHTKHILICTNEYFHLSNLGNSISYAGIHVALASAFPTVPPLETVDHVNDDPTDNHILNLRWLSRSENSRKGQAKSVAESKKNGGKNGRFVFMKQPNPRHKTDRTKATTIGLFKNTDKCAQFILDHVIQKDQKPLLKTVASKIRRAAQVPDYKAYGFYFEDCEIEIEGEDWKHHPQFNQYAFSTHGRAKNAHGHVAQQQGMRNGSRYKQVAIEGRNKYIHRLIWETFVGEIPEGLDVMHDDEAPTNEDNTYRNWLCDFTLGKRSENMESFHEYKDATADKGNGNADPTECLPELKSIVQRTYPKNPLGDLMRNGVRGIQHFQLKGRPTKYVLSRRFAVSGKDVASSGSSKKTDEEKFLEALRIYQAHCKEELQDAQIMGINLDEYSTYIS